MLTFQRHVPVPARLARARAKAAEHRRIHAAERLGVARWLWSLSRPIAGSIAETYLREARSILCPLPATIGFLPGDRNHAPAMIAAFSMTTEIDLAERDRVWDAESREPLPTIDGPLIRPVPGLRQPPAVSTLTIAADAVLGVHLTRLKPDGSDRERDDDAKSTIGICPGSPIVLAATSDMLGLAIAEGIENALTMHETTGLDTWAAGGASRLPALAGAVPAFVECVNVAVDDDPDGRRHAATLMDLIRSRRVEVRQVIANKWRAAS